MTVQEIRYQKLQELLEHCQGNQAMLARQAGTNAAYISQIINRTPLPSGKLRNVGERLARKLERAFHKPHGWMDERGASAVAETRADYQATDPQWQALLDTARQLTPQQLPVAVDMLAALIKQRRS
ncbi:hypothetical protein KFE80_10480 [bacterium SCSIO 12696]|nr:hypothetical protein KFE80_10480 [bacterium SCSIO 12696]